MIVRRAGSTDVPEIVRMGQEFVTAPGYKDRLSIEPDVFAGRLLAALNSSDALVTVLDDGGRICGAIGGLAAPSFFTNARNAVELFWFVRSDARQGGHGRKLLDGLIEWTKAQGCLSLSMIEPPDSELGRLYERLGFAKFETYWILSCR